MMPNSIEFMDCVGCGKRVRTTAPRCHHCGQELDPDMRKDSIENGQDDEFDYQDFLEREFGQKQPGVRRPWWWYVAWLVLAVMVLSIAMDAWSLLPVGR
jgi:hypothetical protein